jgi:hypothetical protein
MMQFNEFLESQGVGDSYQLSEFVTAFLNDPSMFFDLSEEDIAKLEKRMDEALSICRDNISFASEETA